MNSEGSEVGHRGGDFFDSLEEFLVLGWQFGERLFIEIGNHKHPPDRNERSQVADHRTISLAWIASMHVPVAPATQAGARSEVNSKDIDSPNARRPAWSRIKGPKMSPDFNMMPSAADRLLPLAQVNATGEFSRHANLLWPSAQATSSNIQLKAAMYSSVEIGNHFPLWLL
jgi:hypothetical protein